jgi:hypothetical protein
MMMGAQWAGGNIQAIKTVRIKRIRLHFFIFYSSFPRSIRSINSPYVSFVTIDMSSPFNLDLISVRRFPPHEDQNTPV